MDNTPPPTSVSASADGDDPCENDGGNTYTSAVARQLQSGRASRVRLPAPSATDSDTDAADASTADVPATETVDTDALPNPNSDADTTDQESSSASDAMGFEDPAIQLMIPFSGLPKRSVEKCTTFWGNPIIQSVFKFDGIFFGMVAGMAFRYPSNNLHFVMHGTRSVKCRIEQRSRDYFEREIAHRIVDMASEGDQTMYHLCLTEKESGMKVTMIMRLLVSFAPPTRFPCVAWHVTSLELLEIDRTGINICSSISARRERQVVPFGQVMADWNAHQYDFLSAPSDMERPRVWKLRYERWRSLLQSEYYNKNRKWKYLDPAKVDGDWTCGICLERPGPFCTFLMKLPCGHTFHSKCFCNVMPTNRECPAEIRCPMCRHSYSIIEL